MKNAEVFLETMTLLYKQYLDFAILLSYIQITIHPTKFYKTTDFAFAVTLYTLIFPRSKQKISLAWLVGCWVTQLYTVLISYFFDSFVTVFAHSLHIHYPISIILYVTYIYFSKVISLCNKLLWSIEHRALVTNWKIS